jgi:hypothetical protein
MYKYLLIFKSVRMGYILGEVLYMDMGRVTMFIRSINI